MNSIIGCHQSGNFLATKFSTVSCWWYYNTVVVPNFRAFRLVRTMCRELHEIGFHGGAAATKLYFTKPSLKRLMQRCKACHHCPGLKSSLGQGAGFTFLQRVPKTKFHRNFQCYLLMEILISRKQQRSCKILQKICNVL